MISRLMEKYPEAKGFTTWVTDFDSEKTILIGNYNDLTNVMFTVMNVLELRNCEIFTTHWIDETGYPHSLELSYRIMSIVDDD